MKKTVLFIVVLISLVIGSLNGQVYQGFPTANGYWKVDYGNVNCLDIHFLSDICSEYQYIGIDDTLINAEIYHMVSYSGRDRNSIDESWYYWDLGYYGCYRNDIANRSVYYIPKDSIDEILLYDFNINLYDTLPETFVYNVSEYTIITIDQIDSILVNNTYLKRYHLDNAGFGGEYLIEGIGSTLGLLSPITPFFEHHYDLLCFKNEQEELYYFDNDSADCELITDIHEPSSLMNEIYIFPNPSSSLNTIETPTTPNKNTFMTIYNINGQRLLMRQITEQQTVIDVGTLPQGVYFVRVTNDRTVQVGKFVKQ